MNDNNINRRSRSTQVMTRIAILTAISVVLQYIHIPLPFIAPPFMKWDIADMPVLIGGYSMGPMAGLTIMFFKNLIMLLIKGTTTGGVGELSNFIVGSTFVMSAALIYRRHKTFKMAIISLIVAVISMAVVASLSNYFVVFPLYGKLMVPMEKIIAMGSAIFPSIVDLKTMILYSVLPFNLIKGASSAIVALLLYKRISPLLKVKE
ncbi:MAG: ECF transporter S component [Tissierellia bacterium]|nr:ECF transporter S component [Tissierellia bacterium]